MGKVFCFGEFLLRMSPDLNRQWLDNAAMPVYIGGAELNVATALSKWKVPVRYCSALPVNFLSHVIIEELESKNIDTTPIHFSGKRIGVYYLQQGADLKKVDVIYDRANSSFSELRAGMINWDEVLTDCSWFHFSAISPALSEATVELCQEALQAASAKGMTISIDLNYRSKLWQYGKQPEEMMHALLQHCHVVMGNIWDAESLLGISSAIKTSTGKSTETLIAGAVESMKKLQEIYPSVKTIAYTFRLEEMYFAAMQHDNKFYRSKEFIQTNIVDRVGSGDCFMAGLIYGIHNQMPPDEIINFSGAAAVGKMQEKGDATNQTIEDVTQKI